MDRFRASVEAIRRGEEPPEDGYHGGVHRRPRRSSGRPRAGDAAPHRGHARALPHPLRLLGAAERARGAPAELLPRLDTYEQDGALWARSSAYGDDEDRVLLRSDGGAPTYRAADVVYLVDKLERGFDRAIYVLGADHHGTRNWYAAVARMLGYDPARVEVLLYQLVHLVQGGEQKKMSKRRGDVVFLDDFMDEIGVDAARWYLVNRGPDQTIEVDVDLAAERSQKNPVYYVQYAHARIAGILRNAGDAAVSARADGRRSPPRSASWSSASPSSRRSSPRPPRNAARRRSRPTRSASPTTSTASTTSTGCSRATSRRSGSRLCRATQRRDRPLPRPRRRRRAGTDVGGQDPGP